MNTGKPITARTSRNVLGSTASAADASTGVITENGGLAPTNSRALIKKLDTRAQSALRSIAVATQEGVTKITRTTKENLEKLGPVKDSQAGDYLPARVCKSIKTDNFILPPDHRRLTSQIKPDLNLANKIKVTTRVEESLLPQMTCGAHNPEIKEDVAAHLFQYDDEKIDDVLSGPQALNANIHANISCIVDAIINHGLDISDKKVKETGAISRRIHRWFKNPTVIGEPSVEGIAIRSSISDNSNLFVVKVPRDSRSDGLIHEAFVGSVLNGLRTMTPSFMYTYGSAKCTEVATNDSKFIYWCNPVHNDKSALLNYVVLENIRNAVPLKTFIRQIAYGLINVDEKGFERLMILLINALAIAYNKCKFMHLDLHDSNVMVRTFDDPIAIPIYDQNLQITGYIASKYVPYIIDYGRVSLTVEGVKFAYYFPDEIIQREYEHSTDVSDIYKCICFCVLNLETLNPTREFNSVEYSLNQNAVNVVYRVLNYIYSLYKETTFRNISERARNRITNGNDFYSYSPKIDPVTRKSLQPIKINAMLDALIDHHAQIMILADCFNQKVTVAPLNDGMDNCEFKQVFAKHITPQNLADFNDSINSIMISSQPTEKKYAVVSQIVSDSEIMKIYEYEKGLVQDEYSRILNYNESLIPTIDRFMAANYLTNERDRQALIFACTRVVERLGRINNVYNFAFAAQGALHTANLYTPEIQTYLNTMMNAVNDGLKYIAMEKQRLNKLYTILETENRSLNSRIDIRDRNAVAAKRNRDDFMIKISEFYFVL